MTSNERPSGIRAAAAHDREFIIEVAWASGLIAPEEVADIEATLDSFFAGTTAGAGWLVASAKVGMPHQLPPSAEFDAEPLCCGLRST